MNKNLRPAEAAAYEPVQKHKVTPGIPGWLNKFITSDCLHMCSMCLPGAAETPSNAVADWLMPSRRPITCALANRLEKRLGTVKNTSLIILILGKIPTHAFSRIQDKINGFPNYFLVGNHRWQFPTFSRNPDRHGNPAHNMVQCNMILQSAQQWQTWNSKETLNKHELEAVYCEYFGEKCFIMKLSYIM